MKKWVKALLCAVLAVVLLVGSYVAYVFIDYHRLGDMELTPMQPPDADGAVQTGQPYTVISYNIGFGAYEPDYGFFMDGGTESRAWSKERLTANVQSIASFLKERQADFYLLQEVDIGSTRTYQLDEREALYAALFDKCSVFAQNYDSPYLMYPLNSPHGSSRSGLLTFSRADITAAERLVLLADGRVRACGPAEEVMRPGLIDDVYATRTATGLNPESGKPHIFISARGQ